MNKKLSLAFVAVMCCLWGCDSDDANTSSNKGQPGGLGQTRCNATYIINKDGEMCRYGECGVYDADLSVHTCPANIPLCIKEDHGYYCGVKCPDGMQEVANAAEYTPMCEKTTTECSLVDCLIADGHEGWANAECSNDGLCIALECRKGYMLHDNQCLTAEQCCGESCTDCSGDDGWKYGECKDGKCVAELCHDGYFLSYQNDGTVSCVSNSDRECSDNNPCPQGQQCDDNLGKCVCATGRTFCGDGCYSLKFNSEHCGQCNVACGDIEHGKSFCSGGKCKAFCYEGYMQSEDESSCVIDDGSCKVKGDARCGHDEQGNLTVMICQDNYMWETTKTCIMGKGAYVGSCSKDCYVLCIEGYIQNADKSACEPKTSTCKNGEKRCNDRSNAVEYLICKNNKWEVEKNCNTEHASKHACSVETGCSLECTKGYILNSEGTECVFDDKTTCTNGETHCGGMEFHRCENNHWTIVEKCHLQGKHDGAWSCDDKLGCQYFCSSKYVLCGYNTCADLNNDSDNCGSCGKTCINGSCVNGVCK